MEPIGPFRAGGGSSGPGREQTRLDRVRLRIARLAGSPSEVTAIPVVGTPVASIEAVIGRLVPPGGGVLVVDNSEVADPIIEVARTLRVPHQVERFGRGEPLDLAVIEARMRMLGGSVSHLALAHHCTRTGLLNPLERICGLARAQGVEVIVEATGTFAALPVPVGAAGADVVVFGTEGCLQCEGGLAWIVVRRRVLVAARAFQPRSLYLDPVAEYHHLERTGEARFALPPGLVGTMEEALDQLEGEGGVGGRRARYGRTREALRRGLVDLGFEPLLGLRHERGTTLAMQGPRAPWFDPGALGSEPFAQVLTPMPVPGFEGALSFSVRGDLDHDDAVGFLEALGAWIARRKGESGTRDPIGERQRR